MEVSTTKNGMPSTTPPRLIAASGGCGCAKPVVMKLTSMFSGAVKIKLSNLCLLPFGHLSTRACFELSAKRVLSHILVAFVEDTVRVVLEPRGNFSVKGIKVDASPGKLCIHAL